MKTAKELLLEMDAEIAAKVAESVEANKEEIDNYVEARKVEAYNECVARIETALNSQYETARKYLEQLVQPEDSLATDANEVNANEQPINEDAKEQLEPAESVEGPTTL